MAAAEAHDRPGISSVMSTPTNDMTLGTHLSGGDLQAQRECVNRQAVTHSLLLSRITP
jgi:hypothetical protein